MLCSPAFDQREGAEDFFEDLWVYRFAFSLELFRFRVSDCVDVDTFSALVSEFLERYSGPYIQPSEGDALDFFGEFRWHFVFPLSFLFHKSHKPGGLVKSFFHFFWRLGVLGLT